MQGMKSKYRSLADTKRGKYQKSLAFGDGDGRWGLGGCGFLISTTKIPYRAAKRITPRSSLKNETPKCQFVCASRLNILLVCRKWMAFGRWGCVTVFGERAETPTSNRWESIISFWTHGHCHCMREAVRNSVRN